MAPKKRAPRLGSDPRNSSRNKYDGIDSHYRQGQIPWKGTSHFWSGVNDPHAPGPASELFRPLGDSVAPNIALKGRQIAKASATPASFAFAPAVGSATGAFHAHPQASPQAHSTQHFQFQPQAVPQAWSLSPTLHDSPVPRPATFDSPTARTTAAESFTFAASHQTAASLQMADDAVPVRGGSRVKKETAKKRAGGPNRDTPEAAGQSKDAAFIGAQRYPHISVKPGDFAPPPPVELTPHHSVTLYDGRVIEFCELNEHVKNKKGFLYVTAVADPLFPHSIYYRTSEPAPYTSRLQFQDMSNDLYTDRTGLHATSSGGWRSAKANICIRTGKFYYEAKITKGIPKDAEAQARHLADASSPHIRVGFSRREFNTDRLVGYDGFSYAVRDKEGNKMHIAHPLPLAPNNEHFVEGDVIGLEITLPSERFHKKIVEGDYNPAVDLEDDMSTPKELASDVIRDRIPITFKGSPYFEFLNYETTSLMEDYRNPLMRHRFAPGHHDLVNPRPTHPSPSLRTLPGSSIKVYRNGVLVDEAFSNLLAFLPPASKCVSAREGFEFLDDGLLGYFPTIATINGGCAELNFGPDFWYPPPGYMAVEDEVDMLGGDPSPVKSDGPRPASDRYNEQIAEDIVADIVDEIDLTYRLDGGKPRTQKSMLDEILGGDGVQMKAAKELVQDEDEL